MAVPRWEVDNGRRSTGNIFELAQTYQQLTERGVYQRLFGGPVIPVMITIPSDRSKEVADIWTQVYCFLSSCTVFCLRNP